MSAHLPDVIEPRFLSQPSSFAPFNVPAMIDSIGLRPPQSHIRKNSRALVPCTITPASVPLGNLNSVSDGEFYPAARGGGSGQSLFCAQPFQHAVLCCF